MIAKAKKVFARWYSGPQGVSFKASVDAALDGIGFTDAFVDSSVAEASVTETASKRSAEYKVIKDNVWGMITVDAATLRLLDSPLMQRLRGIHQLGFSYLVYPSAEHTRFPHSLGVYHVVQQYAQEINARQRDRPDVLEPGLDFSAISQDDELDLKHAAILHDVGHLPFSHATESVFEADPARFRCGPFSISEFMFPAERELGEIRLSECLSIAMVVSPRFQKFYSNVVRPGDEDAPFRLATLIAGQRLRPENRAQPDLISSGLDADKIDYLNRDAQACNIPLGIDVARLFLRSAFVAVPPNKVPEALRHRQDPTDSALMVFVVNASGIDTIEELAFGRASLYQRVYSHQTTRNAERLLAKALESFLPASSETSPKGAFGDVLRVWQESDLALLKSIQAHGGASPAQEYAARLLARRLPKRAGAFGPKVLAPVVDLRSIFGRQLGEREAKSTYKQVVGDYVEGLKFKALRGERQAELERAIAEESVRVRDLLAASGVRGLPNGQPEIVSVLPLPNLGHTQSKCFVLEPDGHLTSSAEYSKSDELINAEELGKLIGYVFSERPWRDLVFIAMRSVLFRFFDGAQVEPRLKPAGLAFRVGSREEPSWETVQVECLPRFRLDIDRACRRAKIPVTDVTRHMETLDGVGYFDSKPVLALPVRRSRALADLAARFAEFDGERGWKVTEDSLQSFLSQFRPALREHAVQLLDRVMLLDRSNIRVLLKTALSSAFQRGSGTRYLAPLSPNSGSFVRMLFEQDEYALLRSQGWHIAKSISEVLGKAAANDTLILCDDNVSSGSQAMAQFLAWFGTPRSQWPSEIRDEQGIEDRALRPNDLDTLRTMGIGIAVCAAGGAAGATLSNCLQLLQCDNFLGLHFGRQLSPDGEGLRDLDVELVQELERIGKSVLLHCRKRARANGEVDDGLVARCEQDALGYSGLAGLMATMFNVPTSTVTALWCPGIYNNEPWTPLFLRRGYLKHLVLA